MILFLTTVYAFLFLGILRQPFAPSVLGELVMMFVLIGSTALVSGSEVAYFSLSPKQIAELKRSKSSSNHAILRLLADPKKLLATILILNNFFNIAIVIISAIVMHQVFDFTHYPTLDFVIEVIAVTFFIVMFGEVMPKVYATRMTTKLAHLMAFPMIAMNRICSPLSYVMIGSTNLIEKLVKRKGYDISVDELTHAIDLTHDIGTKADEKNILKGIVKFGNIDVKQIMKSRSDVAAFEYKTSFPALLDKIRESGYSRVPVYEGNFDKIAGILYIKDLLPHIEGDENYKWQSLLRQPYFVPESKKISDLLREFQRMKNHMAIVVDEYGGASGIVTMEDILEEIVGDINDEFDDDELIYSKLDDENYVFEGKTLLNDMCRVMEIDRAIFDSAGHEADTLAGLILAIVGKIPKKNDVIDFKNYRFTLESVDKRRIHRVKITILPVLQDENNSQIDN